MPNTCSHTNVDWTECVLWKSEMPWKLCIHFWHVCVCLFNSGNVESWNGELFCLIKESPKHILEKCVKLHICKTQFPSVKNNIILTLTFPDLAFRRGRRRSSRKEQAWAIYVSLYIFLTVRPAVSATTVLPSTWGNMNLLECFVKTVFFFRGSIVKICIVFGSVMFVFRCKGSLKYNRCFLGKQSILTCELSCYLSSCSVC